MSKRCTHTPRFSKQCEKYAKKHPSFENDLSKLKNLLIKHFDENDNFTLPQSVICIDPYVKYRTVYKVTKLVIQGLRGNQCPRIWVYNQNNDIILLVFMDDHINGYKESKAVEDITQTLKDFGVE